MKPSPHPAAIEAFVRAFVAEHEYSPTVREIKDGCGISSTSIVSYHLLVLAKEGKVTFERGKTRTVRPVPTVVAQ